MTMTLKCWSPKVGRQSPATSYVGHPRACITGMPAIHTAGRSGGETSGRTWVPMSAKHAGCRAIFMGLVVLVGLLIGVSCAANATDVNPLQPADTSSPRASCKASSKPSMISTLA